MVKSWKLEICIDSFASAKAAIEGGAKQLEVCSALALGGLTPSVGLIAQIRHAYPNACLMAMIRCRGGDFVYDEMEMDTMENDIEQLKPYASGFVFGFLDESNFLDASQCSRMIKTADGMPCTLHRAFDLTADWKETLNSAVRLGFTTILTSGQAPVALQGIKKLKQIVNEASERIEILIGSGVSPATLCELISATGARSFHASASIAWPSRAKASSISMGVSDSQEMKRTDSGTVRRMLEIMKSNMEK
ncbi:unnamed protein product, partial [Mesorhabditis spiculigera]